MGKETNGSSANEILFNNIIIEGDNKKIAG
jgi:hypothetical protein